MRIHHNNSSEIATELKRFGAEKQLISHTYNVILLTNLLLTE